MQKLISGSDGGKLGLRGISGLIPHKRPSVTIDTKPKDFLGSVLPKLTQSRFSYLYRNGLII